MFHITKDMKQLKQKSWNNLHFTIYNLKTIYIFVFWERQAITKNNATIRRLEGGANKYVFQN